MKKIEFIPKSREVAIMVDKPRPARNYLPSWYKSMPAFVNNTLQVNNEGEANTTAKMCVPFADALTSGYIQETWCDIHVDIDENNVVQYRYSANPRIIDNRMFPSIPVPSGFYPIEFFWSNQWIPKTPRGYSVLYTHPFNHTDLPFFSLTGIVDSDKYFTEGQSAHPFYIKEGFTGIIPQGTPMLQIIPFKRDDWKSEFADFDEDYPIKAKLVKKNFYAGYKKNFWTKKTYK